MLTITELGETMSSARRSLFRLETLDRYEVPIDGSDLSVYLAGGDQPHNPDKLAWEEHLRAEHAATDLTADTVRARAVLSHGARYMQQRVGKIERASELVRSFTPTIVDGLLQTPDYVRAIGSCEMAGEDLESFVASRADRQQILDTDRQSQKIITEDALRWHVGSPQIMAARLEHLLEASHRPNLRLGIIPWTTPVHSPALHCFTIFDDRAVIFGTETATAIITDPADIADYEKRHALYSQLGAWAEQGRPRRRVRIIHDPITDYERYACEWGYALNSQAGEIIRIIDLAQAQLPPQLTRMRDGLPRQVHPAISIVAGGQGGEPTFEEVNSPLWASQA